MFKTFIPLVLILVFVSLSLFYYFNQKARIRREMRREELEEKKQQLMDALVKRNSTNEDDKVRID